VTPQDAPDALGTVQILRTTAAVRERAEQLLFRARRRESAWFTVDDDALENAAAEVADVTRANYPDLVVPYHSRWRHFEAGGTDRRAALEARLPADRCARARAMIDLTVVSVLLDAGAGANWRFSEGGQLFARSEGLGVASFHAFCAGLFAADPADPLRVDPARLRVLTTERLAEAFQVRADNPLVGLNGRVALLRRLGETLPDRPGALFDALTGDGRPVAAHDILSALLADLSGIWLTDNTIGAVPLGDCWPHRAVVGPGPTTGWMPFHKLSQWLTYSLLEPFEWAGVPVTGLGALTGLPEYRNGGLLLDTGVLRLRDPHWTTDRTWAVGDELVVEWRALTVALLDELVPLVCARLGADLPLACVLEGGTWAAGRALAGRLRNGLPPLTVASDGTVF